MEIFMHTYYVSVYTLWQIAIESIEILYYKKSINCYNNNLSHNCIVGLL